MKNEMTESHLTADQISNAADELMAHSYDSLKKETRLHLETCSQCRTRVFELVSNLEEMDQASSELTSPAPSAMKTWLAVAAILLLVLSSGLLWNKNKQQEKTIAFLKNKPQTDSGLILENVRLTKSIRLVEDSIQKQKAHFADSMANIQSELNLSQALTASLYKPNLKLEEEMKLVLRAGTIKLNQPKKKQYKKTEKLTFKWNQNQGAMDLLIHNNQGLTLFIKDGIKSGYALPLKKFSLGTYYFELQQDGELEAMGKFELR